MNTLLANHKEHFKVLLIRRRTRHLERMPVTLSAAKGLARRTQRSFAALRMTARTPLKPAHGKSYLQMSCFRMQVLTVGFGLWHITSSERDPQCEAGCGKGTLMSPSRLSTAGR